MSELPLRHWWVCRISECTAAKTLMVEYDCRVMWDRSDKTLLKKVRTKALPMVSDCLVM